jgi:uncharacterized membrane protein YeaQ/YmgE (transglycosylase-associated protein family)
MSILAWIIVGAIGGWIGGLLVKGDESLGVIGHIVLGIVGAMIVGYLTTLIFNEDPMDGVFDVSSIVTAIVGAVLLVVVWNAARGRSRTGSGPI